MKSPLLRGVCWLLLILGIAVAAINLIPEAKRPLSAERVTLTPAMMEEEQGFHGGDFGFVIRLPKVVSEKDQLEYTGSVYEDGKALPLLADNRAEVDFKGQGRFLFKKRVLSFSSSDSTDPRTNGRTYEIAIDRDLTSQLWAISGGLVFLGFIGIILTRPKRS